jgi:hypothetical protein
MGKSLGEKLFYLLFYVKERQRPLLDDCTVGSCPTVRKYRSVRSNLMAIALFDALTQEKKKLVPLFSQIENENG